MGTRASKGRAAADESTAVPEMACAAEVVRDRVKGALVGLLIADAMAAPTHWFYGGPRQVASTYGGLLSGYTKPVAHLPGSIMSKSATGGGGRGGFQGDVIGKVIFHGKKQFWRPGADYHYHHNLQAGENTLEGSLVLRSLEVMAESGGFDAPRIVEDYIRFMTTPDSHNDTYCGTCHRMFFANYASGKAPKDCPDNDRHNVDTIDALVSTVAPALLAPDDETARHDATAMLALTRDSPASNKYVHIMADMLRATARGVPVREAVKAGAKRVRYDVHSAVERARGDDPLTACYLDSAFPATLFMAYKYAPAGDPEAFRAGVLANANRGGENVGSGALLGALWGAELGFSGLPQDLVQGLIAREAVERLADRLTA